MKTLSLPIALVATLALVLICLAGVAGYLVWDRQAGDDSESVEETTTPALDAPRYTQEEVVAIIMNYEFDFQRNDKTERLTVQHSVNQTVCGGGYTRPMTYVNFDLFAGALQEGSRPCESETSAIYEGNGRRTDSTTFQATRPETARFSFREDTGEVIALDMAARRLLGY